MRLVIQTIAHICGNGVAAEKCLTPQWRSTLLLSISRYPAATMARVRPTTAEESEILDRSGRGDNIVCYRRARILRLSEADWRCPAIAEVLPLHVGPALWAIEAFNEAGIEAIPPQPRSGSRPIDYTQEVADVAEGLAPQEPPGQEGRATWILPKYHLSDLLVSKSISTY